MASKADAFKRIFSGLDRSGGRYVVPHGAKANAEGKVLGRAWTAHSPITIELWEAHLSGKETTVTDEETDEPVTGALGLGVVPIREDGTAVFGAIDVDVYPLDLNKLLARAAFLKLPVIVCRTKSGGAHVYIFFKEPVPAKLVRERLMEWAVAIDHPGVEVFPKQVLLSEYSDGSWINVPYVGGDRSLRYGLKPDGTAMTVSEFIEAVDARAITAKELEDFALPSEGDEEAFSGGPPCLQTLARVGFGDWQNNGLFNVAIYLRLRYGTDWDERLSDYNDKFMHPPIGGRELGGLIKSVKKKEYFYKCKDQPIASVCNRSLCLKRAYGVGSGSGESGVAFGELKRVETDPVTWVWEIDGADVEMASADVLEQKRFRHAVLERLGVYPNGMKAEDWAKHAKAAIENAIVVKVPEDGTREGQFWAHLANFCTARSRARNIDEVLTGKSFTDVKAERAWFRSTDFFAYLAAHRFSVTERDGWRYLRHRGAEHVDRTIKGKKVTLWSVPAFPEQTEEHETPRTKQVEM